MNGPTERPRLDPTAYDGFVFDMDGVITDTATVHEAAWKATFDRFLETRGGGQRPFKHDDYLEYVDGKPRYDGVRSFLRSRGIDLPEGSPEDPPEADTVQGLGNRKNSAFRDALGEQGVHRYDGTVRLIEHLRARGKRIAVISSSRNAHEVLDRAGVSHLFDAAVTGVESAELDLEGKPAPGIFLEAARRLSVDPARAVVIEDAIAGVEAGANGGFGLVIGVDRHGAGELGERGADIVVDDLAELLPLPPSGLPALADLPPAEDLVDELAAHDLAVFLDYDGTLTPIVDDPGQATLPAETKDVLIELADRLPLAIVSGRDLDDVRGHVDLAGIAYAGSHGFDILRADGSREQLAEDYLPDLDDAERELRQRLADIGGARVERKRFAIAVHDREVTDDAALQQVEEVVDEVAGRHERLRVTGGKRIHELRPDIDWDKGRAILALLEAMGLTDHTPVYVGDDETDEDGFRSVKAVGGYAIVVRGEDDDRPTLADAALDSPADARGFLAALGATVARRS